MRILRVLIAYDIAFIGSIIALILTLAAAITMATSVGENGDLALSQLAVMGILIGMVDVSVLGAAVLGVALVAGVIAFIHLLVFMWLLYL